MSRVSVCSSSLLHSSISTSASLKLLTREIQDTFSKESWVPVAVANCVKPKSFLVNLWSSFLDVWWSYPALWTPGEVSRLYEFFFFCYCEYSFFFLILCVFSFLIFIVTTTMYFSQILQALWALSARVHNLVRSWDSFALWDGGWRSAESRICRFGSIWCQQGRSCGVEERQHGFE